MRRVIVAFGDKSVTLGYSGTVCWYMSNVLEWREAVLGERMLG